MTGAVPGKRVIDGLVINTSSFLRGVKVMIAADGRMCWPPPARWPIATTSASPGSTLMAVSWSFDGPDAGNPGNGRFRLQITTSLDEVLSDVALQRIDGRIVLVGQCGSYHCVGPARATDGSYDADSADFGLLGPATADRPPGDPAANGRFLYRFPSTFNSAGVGNGIAVETSNEGKIVIAGTCGTSAFICIRKLSRDGTFDIVLRGDSCPSGKAAAFAS
jgi:hypothetical protein